MGLLKLTIFALGLTLTVKTVFWNVENVQICSPHESDPNLAVCQDLKYSELRCMMFSQWLMPVENGPADLWPDGKIDLKDFAELSRNWRKVK